MAYTPEEKEAKQRAERQANARKQVHFDEYIHKNLTPNLNDVEETPLRRRSSVAASQLVQDPQEKIISVASATVTGNEDGETVEIEEMPAYDSILPLLHSGEWKEYRYQYSTQSINDDLAQRTKDLAAKYGGRVEGPGFFFTPLTAEGQVAFANFSGVMDVTSFTKRVTEHPEAFFQEVKMRFLALQASRMQAIDIHEVAVGLDTNMDALAKWLIRADADIKNLNESVQNLRTSEAAPTGEEAPPDALAHAAGEIADRDITIAELVRKVEDLTADLNTANQRAVDLLSTNRAASVHTQYTEGGTKVRRSAKVDDPPRFNNHPDGDEMPFDLWMMQIENKLSDNADWFPTDLSAVRYITGRLGGQPARDIVPYVQEDHPERLLTAADMKAHLRQQYEDADRKRKAQNEWDALRMIDPKTYKAEKVSYQSFRNAFVRLAGELRKPKSVWKDEFERRLTAILQKTLATYFIDDGIDFNKIATIAQKVDFTNTLADETIRARRDQNNPGGRGGGRGGRGGTGGGRGGGQAGTSGGGLEAPHTRGGGQARGGRSQLPRHSREEFARLMKENRCLECKEVGHRSRECPSKKTTSVSTVAGGDREARLNALYQQFYPDGKSSPDTLDTSNKVRLNDDSENSAA